MTDLVGDRVFLLMQRIAVLPFIRWILASQVRASLMLTVFTVFWNFPSYDLVFVRGEVSDNWPTFFEQVQAPFTDHTYLFLDDEHAAKLGFRFVPAVICGSLGIRNVAMAVIFQGVTLFALHALLFALLVQCFTSRAMAFAATLPFCLVAGGHPYNLDLWGFFDTLALTFLLAAILTRRNALSVVFLLLASFTDERALLASPVLLFFLWGEVRNDLSIGRGITSSLLRASWRLLVAWGLYLVIRLALGYEYGLRTAPVGWSFMRVQWPLAPHALVHGCEGFIVLLGVFGALLWRSRAHAFLLAFVAAFVLVWATAVAVIDLERSMAYVLPYLLLIVTALRDRLPSRRLFPVLALITLINLCYSDTWPLPAQLYRMVFITRTIDLF